MFVSGLGGGEGGDICVFIVTYQGTLYYNIYHLVLLCNPILRFVGGMLNNSYCIRAWSFLWFLY